MNGHHPKLNGVVKKKIKVEADEGSLPFLPLLDEDDLLCREKLTSASPDLWPEQVKGVTKFVAGLSPSTESGRRSNDWTFETDREAMDLVCTLGTMSDSCLQDKVKKICDLAYELGLEEERELVRGNLLNIFGQPIRHARPVLHHPLNEHPKVNGKKPTTAKKALNKKKREEVVFY